MSNTGIFIAFEGIDGAGKTTQVERLTEALRKAGEVVVQSKEPTDGVWGRKIRESAVHGRLPLEEELEAFVEDRKEHLKTIVDPALSRGEIVIVDRYFYSTVAYQGARGGDTAQLLRSMLGFAPVPDIVFLIDVDPVVGISRVAHDRGDTPNELEQLDSLRAVRAIFRELADRPEISLIDGHLPIDLVFGTIIERLVEGPLQLKRCAKNYKCEVLYCSYKAAGECNWFNVRQRLRQPAQQRVVS
jgi:dTMP kinase